MIPPGYEAGENVGSVRIEFTGGQSAWPKKYSGATGPEGTTVTVNEQLALLPQVSLAVAFTVVVPMGKVLPLGGLATMFGVVQPPEAVTV